jgi:hypothetical protein
MAEKTSVLIEAEATRKESRDPIGRDSAAVRGWGRVEWGIGLKPTSILDENPLADVMGVSQTRRILVSDKS